MISSGHVLDCARTIGEYDLKSGDSLTLHVRQPQILATKSGSAFAAFLGDGAVVTWGSDASCGDSSAVQEHLRNVQQIHATSSAFAAILSDGSVVT